MEKEQIQPIEADHADSLQDRDERVEDVEAVQHIHLKTIILLIVRFSLPHLADSRNMYPHEAMILTLIFSPHQGRCN